MKRIFRSEIFRILCAIYALICVMIFMLYLVPCLASKPVKQIDDAVLQHSSSPTLLPTQPPKDALSFVISRGEIIYYQHASPQQDPVTFVLLSFLLVGSIITSSVLTQK